MKATMHVHLASAHAFVHAVHPVKSVLVLCLPANTWEPMVRLTLPCSSSSPICCCLRSAYEHRFTAVACQGDTVGSMSSFTCSITV